MRAARLRHGSFRLLVSIPGMVFLAVGALSASPAASNSDTEAFFIALALDGEIEQFSSALD